MYQGYLEIKYKSMTDEDLEAFRQSLKDVGIDFHRIDVGDVEYYHCLIQDMSLLNTILETMSSRAPVIQGVWDKNGVPKGILKKTDDLGNVSFIGTSEYPFNVQKHKEHSKKIDQGTGLVELESEFKPPHCFLGWKPCTQY